VAALKNYSARLRGARPLRFKRSLSELLLATIWLRKESQAVRKQELAPTRKHLLHHEEAEENRRMSNVQYPRKIRNRRMANDEVWQVNYMKTTMQQKTSLWVVFSGWPRLSSFYDYYSRGDSSHRAERKQPQKIPLTGASGG
jgi:hypothetical protein